MTHLPAGGTRKPAQHSEGPWRSQRGVPYCAKAVATEWVIKEFQSVSVYVLDR